MRKLHYSGPMRPLRHRVAALESFAFQTASDMSEIRTVLVDIKDRLDGLTQGQEELRRGQEELRAGQEELRESVTELREGHEELRGAVRVIHDEVVGLKAWREEMNSRYVRWLEKTEGASR